MAGQGDKDRDKESLHDQIAATIRAQIEDGTLPPGADAPGENTLMADHQVSRTTARLALAALKAEGLIVARQGARTKVRSFEPIRRNATKRLAKEIWGEGRAIWDVDVPDRSRVVEVIVDETEAPDHVRRAFGATDPTTRFCRRSRVFAVDDKPVMLATSYLLADMVAGTAITEENPGEGGIYARLAELGFPPRNFREELRIRMPRPDEARALALPTGVPVVQIARTAATEDRAVVEVNEMTLDSSSYLLEYDFTS